MPTPADTHTRCDDYYCARRDRNGDVRLYCGRGPLVAMKHHTWFDLKELHATARSKQARAQYEAVLKLLESEQDG